MSKEKRSILILFSFCFLVSLIFTIYFSKHFLLSATWMWLFVDFVLLLSIYIILRCPE